MTTWSWADVEGLDQSEPPPFFQPQRLPRMRGGKAVKEPVRKRVLALVNAGYSLRRVAAACGVSLGFVQRTMKMRA